MPVKRRVPKIRDPLITPEAVALFRRGLELQKLGADDVDDDDDSAEHSDDRLEYISIVKRLHWTLLHLSPGDAGPLDVQSGQEFYGGECWLQSVPKALELRALLKKGKTS